MLRALGAAPSGAGALAERGVQLLDWTSREGIERARRAIETLSSGLARPVVLQRFLAEILEGEKRLWLVDGELLARAKAPARGTFVIDMDKGAACERCELTVTEARLARRRAPGARRRAAGRGAA